MNTMIAQPRYRPRQRGIMLLDATVGLIIIGIVGALLATAISRQTVASQRLADQRDAARLADDTLARLQSSQPLPTQTAELSIDVRYLPDSSPVPNQSWAEVTAIVRGREARLTGLAPTTQKAGAP